MKGWSSRRCTLTWKLQVTRYRRTYFLLQASAPRIKGKGSGLLPTPLASEEDHATVRKLTVKDGRLKNISPGGARCGIKIRQLAEQGLLPTPISADAAQGAVIGAGDRYHATSGLPRKVNRSGSSGSVGLARLVQLLPTPVALDAKGQRPSEARRQKGLAVDRVRVSLPGAAGERTGKTSPKLSPLFVAEMMGLPVRWTLLPFLARGSRG